MVTSCVPPPPAAPVPDDSGERMQFVTVFGTDPQKYA
jgi:hypothetical protein